MTLDVGERTLDNSMRLPSYSNMAIKFHKRFRFSGMEYTFQIWVNNLFDNKNVVDVYSNTGRPDTNNNMSGIIGGGTEFMANPTNWSRGRQIILGLSMQF